MTTPIYKSNTEINIIPDKISVRPHSTYVNPGKTNVSPRSTYVSLGKKSVSPCSTNVSPRSTYVSPGKISVSPCSTYVNFAACIPSVHNPLKVILSTSLKGVSPLRF